MMRICVDIHRPLLIEESNVGSDADISDPIKSMGISAGIDRRLSIDGCNVGFDLDIFHRIKRLVRH